VARRQAYEAMEAIELPGGFYRRDIALAASQVPVS
jgi:phosphoribosylamine-glycine ligase